MGSLLGGVGVGGVLRRCAGVGTGGNDACLAGRRSIGHRGQLDAAGVVRLRGQAVLGVAVGRGIAAQQRVLGRRGVLAGRGVVLRLFVGSIVGRGAAVIAGLRLGVIGLGRASVGLSGVGRLGIGVVGSGANVVGAVGRPGQAQFGGRQHVVGECGFVEDVGKQIRQRRLGVLQRRCCGAARIGIADRAGDGISHIHRILRIGTACLP